MKQRNPRNIRGMLLEEVLLFLLKKSGYNVIDRAGNDPTLLELRGGLYVRGRGGDHQIDAIADYIVKQPFSNPQRLLLEAKCLENPVGIPVARNAVGTIKDISEFWFTNSQARVPKSRYHYSYAIFSASGYKTTTQRYAFAQDIYLIPLNNTAMMRNIISLIWDLAGNEETISAWWPENRSLKDFRLYVRDILRSGNMSLINDAEFNNDMVRHLISEIRQISFALLGLINGIFPIFLVPQAELELDWLLDAPLVRPRWDEESWYLFDRNNRKIFSFSLPEELFKMYATGGVLTQESALNLKNIEMGEIMATYINGNSIRIIKLRLDREWLRSLMRKD